MLDRALRRPGFDGASFFAKTLGNDDRYSLIATYPRSIPSEAPTFPLGRLSPTGIALDGAEDCVVHDVHAVRSALGVAASRENQPALWTDLEDEARPRSLLFSFHSTNSDVKYMLRITRDLTRSPRLFDALDQLEARYVLPVMALLHQTLDADFSVAKRFFDVSHDIKQTLTGIKSAASIVRRHNRVSQLPQRELMDRDLKLTHIGTSVDSLKTLLRRTMIPRASRRTLAQRVRPFRPYADLVRPVCETHRQEAETRRLRFEYRGVDQLGLVHADHADLRLVVENLVVNAIKYSTPGETIMVVFERHSEGARIHFASNSLPILVDERDAIFGYRVRTTAAIQSKAGGEGLGLAICRDKMAPYGGAVTLKTEGDINVFTMHLPRGMFRRPHGRAPNET
jgi:signal transduction histidine kinase